MKILHYYTGILLALFIGFHILNHMLILHSEGLHIRFMQSARKVYRNPVIESLLLFAVVMQVISGITLVVSKWSAIEDDFDRIHIASGLYLAFFLAFHVTAVMVGRYKLHLDTNLYYGAGVMNMWPHKLFFIPYYSLAMLSFFFHIACVHRMKMAKIVALPVATQQSLIVMAVGILITALVIFKMSHLKTSLVKPAEITRVRKAAVY